MWMQRLILILAIVLIAYPVCISILSSFSRSNLDDIDTRPEKYRPKFPTK